MIKIRTGSAILLCSIIGAAGAMAFGVSLITRGEGLLVVVLMVPFLVPLPFAVVHFAPVVVAFFWAR